MSVTLYKYRLDLTRNIITLKNIEIERRLKESILPIEIKTLKNIEIESRLRTMLHPEHLEKYFLCLLERYSKGDKEYILKALKLAKEKHHGQYRRQEGTPYYCHPLFAAIKGIEFGMTKKEDVAILLLHDTIEDTNLNFRDIKKGYGEDVAKSVLALSKTQNNEEIISIKDYYRNLSKDSKLAILKGLDRLVNLYSFSFSPPEEKLEYLKETEENIIPLVSIYNEKLVEEMQKVMEYLKDIYVLPPDISLKLEELRKRNLGLGSLFLLEKEDCINKIKRIV